ncbi:hypothetical protein DLAC_10303 [Tieghemostelium lacteum]|uniref:ERCC4 domain-containing protein n=1 Tax=Tieghemostelium lacteum TaxID=361077 RepID=A0A151Z560_TIELA|nr:hypothetical protein DLAC_10303 [Tieghemostelium lacteum]|eukprot:KYQ89075.1 hypothetical protein DLAC_10303 [Tieghemostelium lacteum]
MSTDSKFDQVINLEDDDTEDEKDIKDNNNIQPLIQNCIELEDGDTEDENELSSDQSSFRGISNITLNSQKSIISITDTDSPIKQNNNNCNSKRPHSDISTPFNTLISQQLDWIQSEKENLFDAISQYQKKHSPVIQPQTQQSQSSLQISPKLQPQQSQNPLQISPKLQSQQIQQSQSSLQISPKLQPQQSQSSLQISPKQQSQNSQNSLQISPKPQSQQSQYSQNSLQISPKQQSQQYNIIKDEVELPNKKVKLTSSEPSLPTITGSGYKVTKFISKSKSESNIGYDGDDDFKPLLLTRAAGVNQPPPKDKAKLDYVPKFKQLVYGILIQLSKLHNGPNASIRKSNIVNGAQKYSEVDLRDPDYRDRSNVTSALDHQMYTQGLLTAGKESESYMLTNKGLIMARLTSQYEDIYQQFIKLNEMNTDFKQNEIDIVIDQQEKMCESMVRNFQEIGANPHVHSLPSGDFILVKRDSSKLNPRNGRIDIDQCNFYPFLFERKTWADLAKTLKDKRIDTQKTKMKAHPAILMRFYIIEGNIDHFFEDECSKGELRRAVDEISLEHGFNIIRSTSIWDTCKQLSMIAKMLSMDPLLKELYKVIPFLPFKKSVNSVARTASQEVPVKVNTHGRVFLEWSVDQFQEYVLNNTYRQHVSTILKSDKSDKFIKFQQYELFQNKIRMKHNRLFKQYLLHHQKFPNDPYTDGYRSITSLICHHLDLDILSYNLLHIQLSTGSLLYTSLTQDEKYNLEANFDKDEELSSKLILSKAFSKRLLLMAKSVPDPNSYNNNNNNNNTNNNNSNNNNSSSIFIDED